jgi:hypothetical protein
VSVKVQKLLKKDTKGVACQEQSKRAQRFKVFEGFQTLDEEKKA